MPLPPLLFSIILFVSASAAIASPTTPVCWDRNPSLRVCHVERTSLPIIDIAVDFAAGSVYDPAPKAGLASITRQMMGRSTATMREEALLAAFADIGAEFSGSTELDRAGFMLRTLSTEKVRDRAVGLLVDILRRPTFPVDVFNREKKRIIAALKEDLKSPGVVAARAYYRAIYPDHPYGVSATVETVDRITRADLVDFYRRYYEEGRMAITVVGDASRADVDRIVDRLVFPKGGGSDLSIPPVTDFKQSETIRISMDVKQTHILMGRPLLVKGDPDFFPMTIANQIFGGGSMVSRLMQQVREERGLVYGIYSTTTTAMQPGPWTLALQVEADKADEAYDLTTKLYRDFIENGPTEGELQRTKQYLAASTPVRFESNRSILSITSQIAFYRLPETWVEDYPKRVEAVTMEQVRDVLKRRLAGKPLVTVWVGKK